MPLPGAGADAPLDWAHLVDAAKAFEGKRGTALPSSHRSELRQPPGGLTSLGSPPQGEEERSAHIQQNQVLGRGRRRARPTVYQRISLSKKSLETWNLTDEAVLLNADVTNMYSYKCSASSLSS